jgi:pimeloyl-ACP methyl ester carboxylesterase
MSFANHHEFQRRVIELNGRTLTLFDSGQGLPAVVLETGLGAEAVEWKAVADAVAPFARVVFYDRAGRGSSPPAEGPRSALDMVHDLDALLRVAEIPGPYLIVGHSFGGLIARLYAHHHRHSVLGLVFADSMHEDQFDVFGPLFPPESPSDPDELKSIRNFWTGGWRSPSSTQERIDFPTSLDQGRSIKSLGDLPVHVISAAAYTHMPMLPPPARPFLQQRWDALQFRLAGLSSRTIHTQAHDSGHFVQRDAPDAVIAAIVQMLRQTSEPVNRHGSPPL